MTIREDLAAVAESQRNLPGQRGHMIHLAREQGLTWREIARILDMTENGVHKAYQAWNEIEVALYVGTETEPEKLLPRRDLPTNATRRAKPYVPRDIGSMDATPGHRIPPPPHPIDAYVVPAD